MRFTLLANFYWKLILYLETKILSNSVALHKSRFHFLYLRLVNHKESHVNPPAGDKNSCPCLYIVRYSLDAVVPKHYKKQRLMISCNLSAWIVFDLPSSRRKLCHSLYNVSVFWTKRIQIFHFLEIIRITADHEKNICSYLNLCSNFYSPFLFCVKSAQIRNFSGSYFSCIQYE